MTTEDRQKTAKSTDSKSKNNAKNTSEVYEECSGISKTV
jgi:hypothetical protein